MVKEETSFDLGRKSLASVAAERALPSVYTLVSSASSFESKSDLQFFVLGALSNNAKSSQAKVATFMNSLAKEQKPDFILILGDNFCDWGVDHPLDLMFTTHFYNVYTNEAKVPNIANIPCFIILGNHDENLHHAKLPHQEEGILRGLNQVAHSYLGCKDSPFETTMSKINLYGRDTLDLNHLPAWNMPSRFYSLILKDTQLFCIDSNTYVADFLNAEKISAPNQAMWLKDSVDEANRHHKKTILALHHPLMMPFNRVLQTDLHLYLTDAEIKVAQKVFDISNKDILHISYNELIRRVFIAQNITFNLILSAHDHAIYYFNNKHVKELHEKEVNYPICQVTSGGGGHAHETHMIHSHQQMGCFLKQHGFLKVISPFNSNKIFFNIYTPTSTLKFDHDSCLPLRTFGKQINEVEQRIIQTFCDIVIAALNDYFQFLETKQKQTSHKFLRKNFFTGKSNRHQQEDVNRAHKIWAYIHQETADDFRTTTKAVLAMSKRRRIITNPSVDSFISILNQKLREHYQDATITLENLAQKIIEHE